jgi:hypothetical protein
MKEDILEEKKDFNFYSDDYYDQFIKKILDDP